LEKEIDAGTAEQTTTNQQAVSKFDLDICDRFDPKTRQAMDKHADLWGTSVLDTTWGYFRCRLEGVFNQIVEKR